MVKSRIVGYTSIVLLVILSTVAAKSINESSERIYGGENAKSGQFAHQVSLRGSRGSIFWHFCGGVIISNQIVLSTANCTQGLHSQPQNVTVVVGTLVTVPLESGTSYPVSPTIRDSTEIPWQMTSV